MPVAELEPDVLDVPEDDDAELPAAGLDELDRQHRVLLRRWRDLEDARLRGDRSAVRTGLWFLERSAAEHFAAEERVMEELQYPGRHRHRREHERFGERLRRLRRELDGRRVPGAAQVGWIAGWFTGHLRDEEARLGRFLAERAAAIPR